MAAVLTFNLIWAAIAIHGISGTLGAMAREIARERQPFEQTTVSEVIGDVEVTWHRGGNESSAEFAARIRDERVIIESNRPLGAR